MSSLLIKNADYLVTIDKKRRILRNASIFCQGPEIIEVNSKRKTADKVIDASGKIILPGFVNTHLHIPQVFHRHCPAQQNREIEKWIQITTSINREIDETAAYYGALVCFAELIFSGVTTSSDYFYPFPKGRKGLIEATVRAAKDIGIRFTSIRGSMSLSKKDGTLYDEDIVESSKEIIEKSEEFIRRFHDNSKFSMIRVGLGPCLPWASTPEDYRLTARLAKKYPGVILQTHVAESKWEYDFIKKKYKVSPVFLMKENGFIGSNVSFTHCNFLDNEDLNVIERTKTNVIVCPVCNTRDATDGNGIAPLSELFKRQINISLGCDGAASNDSMNFLEEMRFFRTVSPGKEGLFYHQKENQTKFSYYSPSVVFEVATLGGAKTLNRNDIGSIEEKKASDIVIFNPNREISHAGALNPWAALISCQAIKPEYVIINGEIVVDKGNLTSINLEESLKKFKKIQGEIIKKAEKKLRINLRDYFYWKRAVT